MEPTVDSGQSGPMPVMASASPARSTIVDPTVDVIVDKAGPQVGSGPPTHSYWADCECPGDCLRDHANE